uniref:TOC159 n=1 Tax=Arundo donax TaxID=35708 RepID=A0A0A9GHP1_ARUDO
MGRPPPPRRRRRRRWRWSPSTANWGTGMLLWLPLTHQKARRRANWGRSRRRRTVVRQWRWRMMESRLWPVRRSRRATRARIWILEMAVAVNWAVRKTRKRLQFLPGAWRRLNKRIRWPLQLKLMANWLARWRQVMIRVLWEVKKPRKNHWRRRLMSKMKQQSPSQ